MTGRARSMLPLLLAALAGHAFAKDPGYVGSVHTVGTSADGAVARGTVFLDANRNRRLDAGDRGIAGVLVSNGREVVASGADGRYELPAYDDMNLFITKRTGPLLRAINFPLIEDPASDRFQ